MRDATTTSIGIFIDTEAGELGFVTDGNHLRPSFWIWEGVPRGGPLTVKIMMAITNRETVDGLHPNNRHGIERSALS
jgi:hypothetical protein